MFSYLQMFFDERTIKAAHIPTSSVRLCQSVRFRTTNFGRSEHCDVFTFLFFVQIFDANQDSDTAVYNSLNPPITARFVRLLPVEWHDQISMRLELYGCPGIRRNPQDQSKPLQPSGEIVSSYGLNYSNLTERILVPQKNMSLRRGTNCKLKMFGQGTRGQTALLDHQTFRPSVRETNKN